MLRLSIVIPVVRNLQKLEETLVSTLENRPQRSDITVVLTEPYADPYQLSGEVNFIDAPKKASFVECVNRGVAASTGDVVHVLGCGLEASPSWSDRAMAHFEDRRVASVAPVIISRSRQDQILSAGVGYRRRGDVWRVGSGYHAADDSIYLPDILGPDILSGFYRRSTLEELGGLSCSFGDSLAGVEYALALHAVGLRCVSERQSRTYAHPKELSQTARLGRGREAERLFWTWAPRFGRVGSVLSHIGLVAEECCESVVRWPTILRLMGRATECGLVRSYERYRRSLPAPGAEFAHGVGRPHFLGSATRQNSVETVSTR